MAFLKSKSTAKAARSEDVDPQALTPRRSPRFLEADRAENDAYDRAHALEDQRAALEATLSAADTTFRSARIRRGEGVGSEAEVSDARDRKYQAADALESLDDRILFAKRAAQEATNAKHAALVEGIEWSKQQFFNALRVNTRARFALLTKLRPLNCEARALWRTAANAYYDADLTTLGTYLLDQRAGELCLGAPNGGAFVQLATTDDDNASQSGGPFGQWRETAQALGIALHDDTEEE